MLYLVATPIGNREDITLRALKTLREVDVIFAEDTRKARTLLELHQIQKPLQSFFEHNEKKRTREIIKLLSEGKNIAIISEAGTPGISDPGYWLVQECLRQDVPFETVPGVSAVIAALSLSGLPTDKFFFAGFLPRKPGKRKKALDEMRGLKATIVFFESPHRLARFLQELSENFAGRRLAVVKEITKMHQSVQRFTAVKEAAAFYEPIQPKGEYAIVLEGAVRQKSSPTQICCNGETEGYNKKQ